MRGGLVGRKLGHSLSPEIHRLFGDYEYRLYEREPEELADFVRTNGLDFLNVTIPYKTEVAKFCDVLSPTAVELGNVNLVMREDDGVLTGDNTDAFGVERLLDSLGFEVRGRTCAILGSGGAAMTTKAVLEHRGAAKVELVRRGEEPSCEAALIVNATPVGMFPDVDGVRIDISRFPACEAVADLVYNPSPTRLVREARACGKKAVDGMVMLIAQAYRAFELMNGSFKGSLFLYGPPASGKSTLAKMIAQATGFKLVDLDAEIVRLAGRSIPEIFAADGEAFFRDLERRALCKVAPNQEQVVALGGGALLDDGSRRLVEANGRVVALDTDIDVIRKRLTGADRPLAADMAKFDALMDARREHYASFGVHCRF